MSEVQRGDLTSPGAGFWSGAQADAERICVVDVDGVDHRAGDVLARCNRISHALRDLGLGPGDAVAALVPTGARAVELYLAALQSGLRYVPLDPGRAPTVATAARAGIAAVVAHEQHSGPATALADGLGLDRPARLALGPIRGFTDLGTVLASHPDTTPVGRRTGSVLHLGSEPAAPPVAPRPALGPDEAAGRLTQVLDAFGIPSGREQVHLCTVAPHVPSWVTFAGAALHAGHRVVFSRPGDVAGLLRSIERYRCTYTHLEPDLLEALRVVAPDRRGRHDLSSMRWAVHPAEGCGSEAKQALRSWWGPVVREYRTLALDAAGAPGEATDRSVGPVGGGGALHLCPA